MAEACPRCATPTVRAEPDQPWCPACEWNLAWCPPGYRLFGWRWVDRWLYRAGSRLNGRQFTALVGGPLRRRSTSLAQVITLAAAILLLGGALAGAVAGIWLIFYDFFSPLTVLGVLLLLVAFALRPRVASLGELLEENLELDRASAPTLFAVIDRVSMAAGTPAPDVVLLGFDFGAFTSTAGLRRRRVICLGAPLWATLGPQERVALLGHELGHFVNGDVRRAPLAGVASTTLGRMADAFAGYRETRDDGGAEPVNFQFSGGLVGLISALVGWLLSRVAFVLHLVLVSVSARDSQRAEYLADEFAGKVAGTAAAVRLLDHLLIDEAIDTVVRREARAGQGAAAWRAAAEVARANLAAAMPVHRQLSMRHDVSLFASHPPAGLRARMLERRPQQPAAVVLTEPESARIDDELAAHYEKVRRELAYGDY